MDFVVLVTCNDCGCSFELNGTSASKTAPISCPNCFQPIDNANCNSLRKSISSLSEFPTSINGVTLSDGRVCNGYKIAVVTNRPIEKLN